MALVFIFLLSYATVTFANNGWPRPSSLLAFWPLDSEFGLNSLVGKAQRFQPPGDPILQEALNGPFNVSRSSYSVNKEESSIGNTWIDLKESFTISLFVYLTQSRSEQRGIFEQRIESQLGTLMLCRFCVTFDPKVNAVKLWNGGKMISQIGGVLSPPGTWNFYAFTYDPTLKSINVYHGGKPTPLQTIFSITLPAVHGQTRFALGHANLVHAMANLYPNDAVACVMVYDTALSSFEIVQLPNVCKTKGEGQIERTIPRPSSVLAFWPLDSDSNLLDMAHNRQPIDGRIGRLGEALPGPFGITNPSSAKTFKANDPVLTADSFNLTTDFTITFNIYISRDAIGPRGILSLSKEPILSVIFQEPDVIEILGSRLFKIGSYPILKKGSWTFIAMVYSSQFSIYHGKDGIEGVESTQNGFPRNGTATVVSLGAGTGSYLLNGDGMACVTIFNETLSSFEIGQLISVCKAKEKTKLEDPMPNPESLSLFLPLDATSNIREIAHDNQNKDLQGSPKLVSDIEGPFGTSNTSYSVGNDESFIVGYKNVPIESSFTISFYFLSPLNAGTQVAVASLLKRFSITYSVPNSLELWSGYSTPTLLVSLPVLKKGSWNFFAFAYNDFEKVLDVYSGGDTKLIMEIPEVQFDEISNQVYAGLRESSDGLSYMKTGDSLACLIVYNKYLTNCEIADLPRVCREKGNGTSNVKPSCSEGANSWPRTGSLNGFWLHKSKSQADDIESETGTKSLRVRDDIPGPFGVIGTSSSGFGNEDIASVRNIALARMLTLSFYYRSSQEEETPILSFDKGLGFIFKPGREQNGMHDLQIVSKIGPDVIEIPRLPNVIPLNKWTFFAVTYDKQKRELKVFNESGFAIGMASGVDVQISSENTLHIGYACSGTSRCGFMRETDALACVMLHSEILTPYEISQLRYSCQTNGKRGVSVTSEQKSRLNYSDILELPPSSKYIRRTETFLFFNNSDSASFKSWSNFDGGEVSNAALTRPERSRRLGAFVPSQGVPQRDWRIELEFGISKYVSGERSRFGIILAPKDSIMKLIGLFEGNNTSYEKAYGIIFGQFLPTDNNAEGYFMGGSTQTTTNNDKDVQSRSHCTFTQADLVSGIKMVLQAIDGRLTIGMYSRLQGLPEVCVDDVDVAALSILATNGTGSLSIAVVGSNIPGDGQHTIILKELEAFELTPHQGSTTGKEAASTSIAINDELMSIPSWADDIKNANVLCGFSFADISSLNTNWNYTNVEPSYIFDGIVVDSNQIPTKPTYFRSSRTLPPRVTNWRIEVKLSANMGDGAVDNWSIDFGILQASLNTSFDDSNRLRNFSGFSVMLVLSSPAKIRYHFSPFPSPVVPVLPRYDDRCSLSRHDLSSGVSIAIQSIYDQVSVSLLKPDQTSPIRCMSNFDITGMARLISAGKAIVTIGLPEYRGKENGPVIKIREFRFFSLDETSVYYPEISCLTTTPSGPASTSTLPNETISEIIDKAVTAVEAISEIKARASLTGRWEKMTLTVDSVIPEMPLETTTPTTAEDIFQHCDDFSAKRSVPPNRGEPTKVEFAFQVAKLVGIDNVNEDISINGIIVMKWNVTTCPVNSSSVFTERRERLYSSSTDEIWTPRLRFASSSASNFYMKGIGYSEDLTAVMAVKPASPTMNLEFFYLREGLFTSTCSLNLAKFPFDEQNCRLQFQFIRPTSVLQMADPPIFEWFEELTTSEWNLKGTSVGRTVEKLVGSTVHGVDFNMTLHRLPDYYMVNLAIPTGLIGFVVLATFFIPSEMPDRPAFSVTTLLALIVAQSDVRKELPKKAGSVLLGDYITCIAFFAAIVNVYEILSLCFAVSFRGDRLMVGGVFKKRISCVRLMDVVAFLFAMAAFLTIHLYCFCVMNK